MGRPGGPGDDTGRVRPIRVPPPDPPLTGVCLVRVQVEGSGLRYRVVLNPDISTLRSEQTRECSDLDHAVLVVREFLTAFRASLRP